MPDYSHVDDPREQHVKTLVVLIRQEMTDHVEQRIKSLNAPADDDIRSAITRFEEHTGRLPIAQIHGSEVQDLAHDVMLGRMSTFLVREIQRRPKSDRQSITAYQELPLIITQQRLVENSLYDSAERRKEMLMFNPHDVV